MTDISIVALDSAEFRYVPWRWPFAVDKRAAIDAHFVKRRQLTPEIWNGRVLLLRDQVFSGRTLTGDFFATDYASFMAWEDWGRPDPAVTNCFAMGALRSADGAYLLGEMGAHTAKAGFIYFPAGTPDPTDIVDGKVDLFRSVIREVAEETGLAPAELTLEPGWSAVLSPGCLALMKTMQSGLSAENLRQHILGNLAREAKPEFRDIRIVRSSDDFEPEMPDFVKFFLAHRLPD